MIRAIAWNCQGAFRKKASHLLALTTPDILVIPECEDLEHLQFPKNSSLPTTSLWFGENPNKGLGIFSYTGARISVADCYDPDIRFCVPLIVKKERTFHLLAVWATTGPEINYIAQVYVASQVYRRFLKEKDALVMGDFNANRIWDRPPEKTLFMDTINNLSRIGLVSVYHTLKGDDFGSESQPTLYMSKKVNKPYHVDYVFALPAWCKNVRHFQVGNYDQWSPLSDHCPLWVEFDIP